MGTIEVIQSMGYFILAGLFEIGDHCPGRRGRDHVLAKDLGRQLWSGFLLKV